MMPTAAPQSAIKEINKNEVDDAASTGKGTATGKNPQQEQEIERL